MTQRRGKVLVVGLDGATFDLIEPWAEQGYLPTLSKLMQGGARGRVLSTVPPMTAPAWTSFATGTNPGKHGLYDWVARQAGSYRFAPVTSVDNAMPTLFQILSDAGRRVCLLNVPMTYPASRVNGIMISGMPAPDTRGAISYPADAFAELVATVGDYCLYPDPGQAYSDSGIAAFLDRLYRCTELRVRAFDYLRGREDWDFSMVVFNGTDTVSHALWKVMDAQHPLHDARVAEKYGTAIRDFYSAVDAHLGRWVDGLDGDTTLVVMSDHGFGPFHKFIHVNNWLLREGFMRLRPIASSRIKGQLHRMGFSPMNMYDLLMRLGLGGVKREVVRGQGQSLLKALFLSFEDVDWPHTVAYSLGNVGQIRVNRTGREPQGCVRAGDEYEALRNEIIAKLMMLRDPATGETVVEQAYRREDIYSGEQIEHAPDILFIPRRLEYFGFGEYEFGSHRIIQPMARGISGTHRMYGVFTAFGAGARAGSVIEGARLVDLAPTILHLVGEPVPAHMDGRVLSEALAADLGPARVVPSEGGYPRGPEKGHDRGEVLTADEERALAERLRSLGYVG